MGLTYRLVKEIILDYGWKIKHLLALKGSSVAEVHATIKAMLLVERFKHAGWQDVCSIRREL